MVQFESIIITSTLRYPDGCRKQKSYRFDSFFCRLDAPSAFSKHSHIHKEHNVSIHSYVTSEYFCSFDSVMKTTRPYLHTKRCKHWGKIMNGNYLRISAK